MKPTLPLSIVLFILSSLDEPTWATPPNKAGLDHARNHGPNSHHDPLNTNRNSNLKFFRENDVKDNGNGNCRPVGACEPCPHDLLDEPFCQPFGNRRLVNCMPLSSGPPADEESERDESERPHPPSRPPAASLPAWESCGRLVPKERADFFEFVLCNVIFAALSLAVVLLRTERMRAVRARRLAARIGVGLRRASGSWRLGSAAVSGMDGS